LRDCLIASIRLGTIKYTTLRTTNATINITVTMIGSAPTLEVISNAEESLNADRKRKYKIDTILEEVKFGAISAAHVLASPVASEMVLDDEQLDATATNVNMQKKMRMPSRIENDFEHHAWRGTKICRDRVASGMVHGTLAVFAE